jgi:ribosomal protein S18 acetylase RimI-like enzyme
VTWTIAAVGLDDIDEVARVHVRVWQEAYAGLMPADYLDRLDPVTFASHWRERLRHPAAGVGHWVARDGDGVIGITTSGPARDDDGPVPRELYAINVLARAHGTGVANELLTHAIGNDAAYLWVLEGNQRARAFYERHGFADDGGRKREPDTGAREVRMSRDVVAR